MKKLIAYILVLTLAISLSSCNILGNSDTIPKDEGTEYLERIILLQSEISKLNEKYDEYVEASSVKLETLSAEIEALKREESESKVPEILPEKKEFLYEIEGETAILTGYEGSETILVIPSHIDGYPIIKIGEKAFASSKITTVIISDGVKEIDWFAFMGSTFLTNVTIPKSVTKIGYSAFDGCSPSLTIYCERDSYAHAYAQSFGIPYVLI